MTGEIILGTHFSPKFHLRVGETEFEVETLIKIIHDYKIEKFVEIGVHEGGLTEYLLTETNVKYLGVEINSSIPRPEIKELIHSNKTLVYLDCFSSECYDLVEAFVSVKGRTLIYCDNGDKPEEIKWYHTVLWPADLLLTHDYSDGIRIVRGLGTAAPAREVTPEDVAFLNSSNNFEPLPEELLKETRIVGWMRI